MKIRRSVFLTSAIVVSSFVLIPFPAWSGQQCQLVEMKITGQTARASGVSVDLGEASPPDPVSPFVYQGPPRIRVGDGPVCTADQNVSIIFGPLWLGLNKVYISTYSGSENVVFAIDAKSCHTLWKRRYFEGGPAKYQNGSLIVDTHRVHLNKSCMPSR